MPQMAEQGMSRGPAGLGAGEEQAEVFLSARTARRREPLLRAGAGSQVFWRELQLFLVSFFVAVAQWPGVVTELPEDNSRVHWGKVTLQWHRSDLGLGQ